jgi:rSAM/selenodomain-associated transferase 2
MAQPTIAGQSIAVLIPTLNEASEIVCVIRHLHELGFDEVIVADGGSSDATIDLARGLDRVRIVEAPRGRGSQMNAAAAVARSSLLVFLHADSRLPDNAAAIIRKTLSEPLVAAGAFRVRFDDPHPALALFAWFSRFDSLLSTFGDQGYFMRRDDFRRAGGFPTWPLLEDVELRRRLKRLGRFVKVGPAATTSARRFRARGPWRAQIENALILMAFSAGASPHWLARFYHRRRRPADATPRPGAR